MKSTTTTVSAVSTLLPLLLSIASAASVHLATTGCVNPSNNPLEEFDVPIIQGSDAPTVRAINNVCGIKVVSVTAGVDINAVQCQAFRDTAGTQLGSALFSYDSPALIATNPVQENSIRCVLAPKVHLQSTACPNSSDSSEDYEIPLSIASNQAIVHSFNNICGLKIIDVSDAVDVNQIQCQAFKDSSATQPGSALFTYSSPALISTNPVQEQAIRCVIASPSYRPRR